MNKSSPLTVRLLVFLLVVCFLASAPALAEDETLSPDQLEKGMTGYGVTVFEGTESDTFPVEVLGVLNNVMPDQDIILIKANTKLLNHTMIMSGMSGSPIYIDGKMIGALAYSWSFEKEPIAGVTPIENIRNAKQRETIDPSDENLKKIGTPMVASGFRSPVKEAIGDKLTDRGLPTNFVAGGQAQGTAGDNENEGPNSLEPGSALGVQLMRGDLSLTAIGTVTDVDNETVYAFGHPFLGAGQIEFPMTTARVHTYMPSYQSSFKLASPIESVGTITEDRQASIVGQTGVTPDLLPVDIHLSSPDQNFESSYRVEIIRNRELTPGLLNSAVSNFASRKLEQQGVNWIEADVRATLKNQKNIEFKQVRLIQGSYSPWTILPLYQLWTNQFEEFHPETVTVNLTLHHGQESARIEDIWVNRTPKAGEPLTIYTKINPFRSKPVIRKKTVQIPNNLSGSGLRISVVPASELQQLEASPTTFSQLVDTLNTDRSPKKLAIVVEMPEFRMNASGHRMEHIPFSIAGSYQYSSENQVTGGATPKISKLTTDWILGGSQTIEVQLVK